RKESNPALPIWPQPGREKILEVGRANVQESSPAWAGVRLYDSGATGVYQNVPAAVCVMPVLISWPGATFGRHGPASSIVPHSPILGVNGRPVPYVRVFVTCQPPTIKSMARPEPLMNFLPLPTGNS